jgi:hypothetical protein
VPYLTPTKQNLKLWRPRTSGYQQKHMRTGALWVSPFKTPNQNITVVGHILQIVAVFVRYVAGSGNGDFLTAHQND